MLFVDALWGGQVSPVLDSAAGMKAFNICATLAL